MQGLFKTTGKIQDLFKNVQTMKIVNRILIKTFSHCQVYKLRLTCNPHQVCDINKGLLSKGFASKLKSTPLFQ